ncbi:MAG: hypothetical protein P1S60_04370 [Anaerolineae bacterium]|nr:hypothetical protein [Anaerolineae bacterium]
MKKDTLIVSLLIPLVVFALVGAFATIMTSYNHNEHMYITASVLVAQGQKLYQDFAYLQTPYLPIIYGTLFRLLGISYYYYLIGKVISFILLGLSALFLLYLALRIADDWVFALSLVVLFLFNSTILIPAAEVSNYIAPLTCSLASFTVFVSSIHGNHTNLISITIAGLLNAVAIGIKLTYTTVALPYFVIILLIPLLKNPSSKTMGYVLTHAFIPFTIGFVLGLLPILTYMTDLESFYFNNLGYHNTNMTWREQTGYSGPFELTSKIFCSMKLFTRVDNLVVLTGISLGIGYMLKQAYNMDIAIKRIPLGAYLALSLFLVSLPTALAPTPSFPQYFAMPVSYLFLLFIYTWSSSLLKISTLHQILMLILLLTFMIYREPGSLKRITSLQQRDAWVGLKFHDDAISIRNTLIDNGVDTDSRIATLAPLYVTESNLKIYPEFSTGSFLYRIGNYLSQAQRERYISTSITSVSQLLSEEPPAALLIGFYQDMEKPFGEYIEAHTYLKTDVEGVNGELYIKP